MGKSDTRRRRFRGKCFTIMVSCNPSLSEEDLAYLKKYKYKAGAYTPLDTVLSSISQKTVCFVPEWISPNAITLIGFVLNVIGMGCLSVLKTADGATSRLAFLINAVTSSLYIYLDMLDGKQARRLGCSSPLGQLFDHGCDSLSISCFLYSVIKAIGIEDPVVIGLMFGVVGFVFVSFQLIEYFQDVLMFGTSFCGVSEVEVLSVFVMLLSFAAGTSVWSRPILFEYTLRDFSAFFTIVLMGGAIFIKNVLILIQGSDLPKEEEGNKNNSRTDHVKRFIPLLYCCLSSFTVEPFLLSFASCPRLLGCIITRMAFWVGGTVSGIT